MKKSKRALSLLVAAAMAASLTACGGGGATSSAGTSSPDSSSLLQTLYLTVTADVTGDRAPYVERFAQLVEEKTEGRYTASSQAKFSSTAVAP